MLYSFCFHILRWLLSPSFLWNVFTLSVATSTSNSYDRVYFGSIAFIWAAGICAAVLYVLSIVHILGLLFTAVANSITTFSSLCVVCTRYLIVRCRLRRSFPIFDNQTRRDMERNSVKLSKTLFMVKGLSLVSCSVPAALLYTATHLCKDCTLQIVVLVATALHLANSIRSIQLCTVFKEELRRRLNKMKCNFLQQHGNEDTCGPKIFDAPL